MSIIQLPLPLPAESGILPATKKMVVTDNLAALSAPGFLNSSNLQGSDIKPSDHIEVVFNWDSTSKTGIYGQFTVNIVGGVITLTEYTSATGVNATLPSVANEIAVFSNVSGDIKVAGANSLVPGSLTVVQGCIAGAGFAAGNDSGVSAGYKTFPNTPAKGSLVFTAADNTGDTETIITNEEMGQSTTLSFADPGVNTAQIPVIATAGLPTAAGQLMVSSGTSGKIETSNAKLVAKLTAPYAGGGTTHSYVETGMTSNFVVSASVRQSTNPVSIVSAVPALNALTIDFSADPGPNTIVQFLAVTPGLGF